MSQMNVAIAGLGVVGAKTAQLLLQTEHASVQDRLRLVAVSARNKQTDRGISLSEVD